MNDAEWASVRLFEGIAQSELPELASAVARTVEDPCSVEDGRAEHLFVVLQGALLRHVDGRVERYDAGEVVNLDDAVGPDLRRRAVVAAAAARWASLPSETFRRAVARHPRLQSNLATALVRRLRDVERRAAYVRDELDDIRRVAAHDPLTHVFNRRWLDENLPRLHSRATPERPLSVVMVDVDHFKRLNDTVGHTAGDRVLAAVADTLRRRFRPADLVVRYGGEEFAVLMPGTDLAAATKAAERVREAVAETRCAMDDGTALPPVTVSCGVAASNPEESGEALFQRADGALYRAKARGRNRVEVAVAGDRRPE